MTLEDRLLALADALGADVSAVEVAIDQINDNKADRSELGPLAQAISDIYQLANGKSTIYKAASGAPVGAGQPAGTWIARPVA